MEAEIDLEKCHLAWHWRHRGGSSHNDLAQAQNQKEHTFIGNALLLGYVSLPMRNRIYPGLGSLFSVEQAGRLELSHERRC